MTIHQYLMQAGKDDARRAGERERVLLEARVGYRLILVAALRERAAIQLAPWRRGGRAMPLLKTARPGGFQER